MHKVHESKKVTMDYVIIMVTLLLLAVLSTNIVMCRSGSKYIPLFCHLMSIIKSVLYLEEYTPECMFCNVLMLCNGGVVIDPPDKCFTSTFL